MLYGGHVKTFEDIEFLRSLGLDFGELVLWNAQARGLWRSSGITNEFSDGFFLLAHGPNEGSPNDLINLRNRCLPRLCKTIDVVSSLGIQLLVIHLWMDRRFVKPEVRDEKKRVLRELFDYGLARKVLICIENLSEDAQDLGDVLKAVPGLGITLDVGHGQLLTEINTSFAIIDQHFDSIRHVHLHDNKGGTGVADDLHLPIGEGSVDFQGILAALVLKGYKGTITLEVKREFLASSLAKVKSMIARPSYLAVASQEILQG
jgi:sugar phosphate isomerase/epimerase